MIRFFQRGGLCVLVLAYCIFFCGYDLAKEMYSLAAFQALLSGINLVCFIIITIEDDD